MSKNVLIISSSPRKGGNSEAMCAAFAEGAAAAGHNVETISLCGKQLNFCVGCFACHKVGKCVHNDDATAIVAKMHDADVICFASPVYYYSVSGQLKTLFDRSNPLYDGDYKYTDIYFLSCAAEDEDFTVEGSVKAVQGWVDCFDRAALKGTVFAGGVNEVGDIAGHKALEEAKAMGANI